MSNGTQIGKYQLVAEIARGGMGIVYLAIAKGPGRFSKFLVLKELKPELAEDPAYLEMFFEEARLAARLNHPNISHIYEVDSESDRHFIVMDYLDGRPLSRVLRRHDARFTLPMALRVLCDVLQGLEYAHTLSDYDGTPIGIVHRDVTPQNVFITFDGQIKVVDFGIAKSNDSRVETRAGTLKGKPAYMSPEQVTGVVDPRTDIFAVGSMLFELVSGRRVWQTKPDVEILTGLIKGEIPSLVEAFPSADPELARICAKAMAVLPADRYPDAASMRAELEAYLTASRSTVTARDVGTAVATMFEAERAQTRAAIESHVAAAKAGELGSNLPRLTPGGRLEGTPSASMSGRLMVSGSTSLPTPDGTVLPTGTTRRPEKKRPLGLVLLGAVLLLGLGGFFALRSSAVEATREASASPMPSAAPPPAAPAPDASAASPAPGAPAALPPVASAAASADGAQDPSKHLGGGRGRPGNAAPPSHAAPKDTATVAAAPPPAPPPAARPNCDPPFYFEGTKKVFKPGCL